MAKFNTRFTFSVTPDGTPVCNEVITSAVRVLSLLGYERRDIADLFEAAVNELRQDHYDETESASDSADSSDGSESDHELEPSELHARAEQEDFHKELTRISKRLSALLSSRDQADPKQIAALLVGMIGPLARAQHWYEEQCETHDLEFAYNSDEWRVTATDEMLDCEDAVVFFEEAPFYERSLMHLLEWIAHDLEKLGEAEPISQLLRAIEEERLELPATVVQKLQKSLSVTEYFPDVMSTLQGLELHTDLTRSELVDAITSAFDGDIDAFTIEDWLGIAAKAGLIEMYKKGNRWRIRRLPPAS